MPTEFSIPDSGAPHVLDLAVRVALAADEPLELWLFRNNITPSRTTHISEYQEPAFAWYTRRVINRSAWAAAVIEADHVARIRLAAGPQMYLPTVAGETIYGCLLVRPSALVVSYARRFTSVLTTVVNQPFRVNPIITLRSEAYTS